MISFKQLSIPDVILITPQVFNDDRGLFFESFNQKEFEDVIGQKVNFVQDNESYSNMNVLRGLHYQRPPYEQSKLVRVVDGQIFDVAVDIRSNSPTRGKWVGEILSSSNKAQMWIPRGFAHGFQVISRTATVLYKTDSLYSKDHEVCLKFNDPFFNVSWPNASKSIVSIKDSDAFFYKDYIQQYK